MLIFHQSSHLSALAPQSPPPFALIVPLVHSPSMRPIILKSFSSIAFLWGPLSILSPHLLYPMQGQ
jgi:hypothetical protein